jgi:hypothetical protein
LLSATRQWDILRANFSAESRDGADFISAFGQAYRQGSSHGAGSDKPDAGHFSLLCVPIILSKMASKGNAEKAPDRPALPLERGRNFFRGEGGLWLPVTEWVLSKIFSP